VATVRPGCEGERVSNEAMPAETWTAVGASLVREDRIVGSLSTPELAEWVAEACETLAEMDKAQADWEASGEALNCAVVNVGGEQMRVQGGAEMSEPLRNAMAEVWRSARRALAEAKAAERAEIARDIAERVLLVSEVMTGYRCPACHGLPASHKYPRYRCGCGQQWDLTRSEQYRLSHEHSPRKLLLRIVSTGELPEIPTSIALDLPAEAT